MTEKPKKLFISHSEKDKAYVSAIVDLLTNIGMTEKQIFCSSVPGFGIEYGEDIYEYLKDQFVNYDLYVLFILSNNYYRSAACLNEMGAAWVLQKKYNSILLPGFEFSEMRGAVNPRRIAMKLEGYSYELKNNLKQLVDDLTVEFTLREMSFAFWERHRNHFLEIVNSIQSPIEENEQEMQSQPQLSEVFRLSTDDEKIITYYILTEEVCSVEETKFEEWMTDNEVYDVNIQNGFTLLEDFGKREENKLTIDRSMFRFIMTQKDSLISEYEKIVNSHKYISAEEFQRKWSSMDNCEKLLAAYISDKKVSKLGARWMADSQIEDIKVWEKDNNAGKLLSNMYNEALQFFIDNRFVYESDWTTYNNPREYTLCKSLKEFLMSGLSNYDEELKDIMIHEFMYTA